MFFWEVLYGEFWINNVHVLTLHESQGLKSKRRVGCQKTIPSHFHDNFQKKNVDWIGVSLA